MKRNPLGPPGVGLAPGGVPPKPPYPLIIRRERPWPNQCARVFSCATPRRAWSAGGRIAFTAGSQQDSGSGFLLGGANIARFAATMPTERRWNSGLTRYKISGIR